MAVFMLSLACVYVIDFCDVNLFKRFEMNFVMPSVASQQTGVSIQTLRRWAQDGKIDFYNTRGGQYRYNVDSIFSKHAEIPDLNDSPSKVMLPIAFFMSAVTGVIGVTPIGSKTAGEIFEAADQFDVDNKYRHQLLRDFLEEFKFNGRSPAKRLGWWLSQHSKYVVNGRRISAVRDKSKKQQRWYIEIVEV